MALKAEDLANIISQNGVESIKCETIEEAVVMAMKSKHDIIAIGSLYMIGDIKSIFRRENEDGRIQK